MSLASRRASFTPFGLVVRATQSDGRDAPIPVPEGTFAVFALEVPAAQAAALQAFDGHDPTVGASPPTGARLRRLLHQLREDGELVAWATFVGKNGATFLHIQVTAEGAQRWWRHVDWASSTLQPISARDEHVFI